MKRGHAILLVIVLLVILGCARETATTPAPVAKSTPATPAVAETPTTPAPTHSTTTPPPGAATVSSEPIGGTRDCTVSADCVSYVADGTPGELCAHYDEVGCYHSYACTPSGEVVQKETPAFCGRA